MASHIVPIMQPAVATVVGQVETDHSAFANSTAVASPPPVTGNPRLSRGTTVKLSIPLDAKPQSISTSRKLLRRDSLDRREALLKGNEGSRQRRRWENDRLLNNPYAEPPLPIDWEVRPTHPVRRVPYYLAPLWDAAEFQRAVESNSKGRRNTRASRKKRMNMPGVSPFEEDAINISRDVRGRLKHARSAKGLLQDLEEDVRGFLVKWNERECRLRSEGLHDAPLSHDLPMRIKPKPKTVQAADSAILTDTEAEEEDEEIVFVGRKGGEAIMHDSPSRTKAEAEEDLLSEKLVFEGLEDDKGAAFGRWLAHCIGSYYGLRTWSVTTTSPLEVDIDIGRAAEQVGSEKVRQAYVGVDSRVRGWMGSHWEKGREFELPRPLYAMV